MSTPPEPRWRVRHRGIGVFTYGSEEEARIAAGTAGELLPSVRSAGCDDCDDMCDERCSCPGCVAPVPEEAPKVLYRVGRKVGRTVYRQVGPAASDADELIGVMDTPELARFAAAAMSGEGCGHDPEAFDRQARELETLRAVAQSNKRHVEYLTRHAETLEAERNRQAERAEKLAQTVAAIPGAHHAANLAHARVQRDRLADTLRAVQPVVEAAKEWRAAQHEPKYDESRQDTFHRLIQAVDALGDVDPIETGTEAALGDAEEKIRRVRDSIAKFPREGEPGREHVPDAALVVVETIRAALGDVGTTQPEEITEEEFDRQLAESQPVEIGGPVHDYLSTACLHGRHEHCRSTVNTVDGGPKKPATCKFCPAVCRCEVCHHDRPAEPLGDTR